MVVPCPQPGHLSGIVPGGFFTAVGVLLLLIHDDKAELLQRGENGGTGAHYHIHLTTADALIFIQALA